MDVIKIYNPNEWPYGKLSNNSIHYMRIDNVVWNTVTNFIYANTLNTPIYKMALMSAPIKGDNKTVNIEDKVKQIVANIELGGEAQFKGYGAPIYGGLEYARKINQDEIERVRQQVIYDVNLKKMDIYQLHNHYLGREYVNIVTKAIEKAYHTLLNNNIELQQILLNTGNRPIYYLSSNNILGIANGDGANIVGNTLMQIRHEIFHKGRMEQSIKNKSIQEEQIFNAYIVKYLLEDELKKGVDIVKKYDGLTPEEILEPKIRAFETKEAIFRYLNTPESIKPYVIKMYNMGKFPSIEKELQNPGTLAKEIKKENLEDFKEIQRNSRNKIILRFYVIFQLKSMNPNISDKDLEMGIDQFLSEIPSTDDYENLAKRVSMLYFTGGLPENVSTMIHDGLVEGGIDDTQDTLDDSLDKQNSSTSTTSSTSSSSYEDEDDEIANQFVNDKKARKKFLISELSKYTGKHKNKFRGWTLSNLEDKYKKYIKNPVKEAGSWIVELKNRDNTKELLAEFEHRPSDKDIEKIIRKYNKNSDIQIKSSQLVTRFKRSEFNKPIVQEEKIEKIEGHIKYNGDPVNLSPIVQDNEPFIGEFSPLFIHNLVIDGLKYDTISSYLTTMLLAETGIQGNIIDKGVFKRGRPINEARSMIIDEKGNFLSPQEAGDVYMAENIKTHKNLINILAHVALKKKFEDIDLQYLLQSTGNKYLQWNDPNDVYLGGDENQAGKIMMEIRSELKLPELFIDKESLPSIVTNDGFIKEWIRMQVSDMCNTVGKLKCYIWKTSKIDEDIDRKFVKKALNEFYSPCLDFSKIAVEIPIPNFFKDIVSNCFGMNTFLDTNYVSQIIKLQEKLDKAEATLWGVIQKETPEKKEKFIKFLEKSNKAIETLRKNNLPIPPELKENFQRQLDSYFQKSSEPINKDETRRKRWFEFIDKLNSSALSPEEISKKMRKFDKKIKEKYGEELSKERKSFKAILDKIQLEKVIKKERADYWNSLLKPEMDDPNDRRKAIDKFIEREEEQNKKKYGRFTSFKEAEQKLGEYKEIIKEKIQKITNDLKLSKEHHRLNLHDVTEIYWNRICVMLGFFLVSINKTFNRYTKEFEDANQTVEKVHKYLIQIQNQIAQKTSCEIISPILDDESNCIASALTNLLIKLQNFKRAYCECPLSKEDIDLCVSIILDMPIPKDCRIPKKSTKITEVKDFSLLKSDEDENEKDREEIIDVDKDEEDDEKEDDEKEDDENEENKGSGDYSDEEDEDEDANENEENDDINQDENDEEALFGFGENETKEIVEPIKMLLSEINNSEPEKRSSLADHFLKMIEFIKKYSKPDKTKQNRINFFATLIR